MNRPYAIFICKSVTIIKEQNVRYKLTLAARYDLKRICDLLEKHTELMELLNEDSKKSPAGGAAMSYEVKIELKERWT